MRSIVSCYVREQQRYDKSELMRLFSFKKQQEAEKFIRALKSYGVLKAVKNNSEQRKLSDLADEDIQIADETAADEAVLYVFSYVGVIIYANRVIKIYPKYLLDKKYEKKAPLQEMKQVLKVLERYSSSKEQMIHLFHADAKNHSFSLLSVMLFLLGDYYENGVYHNSGDIIEVNGDGEILWPKTIDEGFTIIRDNRPYYTELYTKKTIDDDMDYFKRLHECILTECSHQLQQYDLVELFDIVPVELSEHKLADFGDDTYILDRIQGELNVQFHTRQQIMLKAMDAYVSLNEHAADHSEGVSMYGTNAFHTVWEKICAEVFHNKLEVPLGGLGLTSPIMDGFNKQDKLKEIIDAPQWKGNDMDREAASKTLIPDMITTGKGADGDYFVILDAKYYVLQLEKDKPLRGNPGVEDVVKQYLYQLAYKKFTDKHNIVTVKNCFLMPTDQDGIIAKGMVRIGMLEALELENIQIRLLPAHKIYQCYLERKQIPVEDLVL